MTANNKQIAGDHYKKYGDLQPWDVVIKWNLGYLEGTALKYIARWRDKGGIDDIKKAIHFLEKLVELNTPVPNSLPILPPGELTKRSNAAMGGFCSPTKESCSCWGPVNSELGRDAMTQGLKEYHNARDV